MSTTPANQTLPIGAITRPERPFLILFMLALAILTTIPYLTGYLISVPGTVFTGIIEHSYDTNNYLSYAHQSAEGHWLFRNPMTAEPHRAVFFNLEWLLIGKIARLLHVTLPAATNILRLLCLALMCYSVYWLSSFLFRSLFLRRLALVAALAGGGFGWIVAVHLLRIPINSSYFLDLTNANLFPFYWTLKLPHFLVSESFVILGLACFLHAEHTHRPRHYFAAGLCSMAAGACRPYDMLFLMAAITLFLALSLLLTEATTTRTASMEVSSGGARASIKSLALRSLPVWISLPLLAYYFWIFKLHPIFHWWSLPGNPAPAPWLLAIAFGMTTLLLPFAAWRLFHTGLGQPGLLMFSSVIAATAFAHMHSLLHFSFQFATNIFVPLVMLVLLGLQQPILDFKSRHPWGAAAIVALLILNSLTSIALDGQAVVLVLQKDFRIDAGLLAAYAWLDQHSRPGDIVLADFDQSSQIPQYTHNTVYCGYINTVNLATKEQAQQQFLDPHSTNQFRQHLLQDNSIRFVLLTQPQANAIPSLPDSSFLKPVFTNGTARIYEVASSQ